jgi:large subunit ribosomal protein L3
MNQKKGLVGRKLGMTQLFKADGDVVPVTVIEAGPCTVIRVKTPEGKDRYSAVQFGFGEQKASRLTKADIGQLKPIGRDENPVRHVKEIRVSAADASAFTPGSVVGPADVFEAGQRVDVQGISKGRGFAGVMKRHNFAGFESSHGAHEYFRHGGSIGTRLTPGMTLRGKRMGGHMGAHNVTVQNMVVAAVDAERNLIYIRGGVPGPTGGLVTVRATVKNDV